jgi:hypothetical protein
MSRVEMLSIDVLLRILPSLPWYMDVIVDPDYIALIVLFSSQSDHHTVNDTYGPSPIYVVIHWLRDP